MIAAPIIKLSMTACAGAQLVCRRSADTRQSRVRAEMREEMREVVEFTGSPGWIRTSDHSINSRMLYR